MVLFFWLQEVEIPVLFSALLRTMAPLIRKGCPARAQPPSRAAVRERMVSLAAASATARRAAERGGVEAEGEEGEGGEEGGIFDDE